MYLQHGSFNANNIFLIWIFGPVFVGIDYLCFNSSHLGKWNSLKIHSITSSVAETDYWVKPYRDLLARIPRCDLSRPQMSLKLGSQFQGTASLERAQQNLDHILCPSLQKSHRISHWGQLQGLILCLLTVSSKALRAHMGLEISLRSFFENVICQMGYIKACLPYCNYKLIILAWKKFWYKNNKINDKHNILGF